MSHNKALTVSRSNLKSYIQDISKTCKGEEERIEWLRRQVIGNNIEIETPFGKRMLTYADHTASGRCLHYIEDYIARNVLPFYANTHTTDSFVGNKTSEMVSEATEYIKRCMGAGPDNALLFCGSGTTACIKRLQEMMGIAVPSIMRDRIMRNLSNNERWVVFIGPYEHHSNILSWRQSLAEVVEIGTNNEGLIDMDELTLQLQSPMFADRPMLGSFSACSNVTGILSDTRALARLLHQHGAFACFDFAASGPYVEIDMKSGDVEGYDAVYLSPHKFVGGPGSPGILLMNKALYQLKSSPPSTCGGGTVSYVNGFSEEDTLYYDDIEEREDAGTPPIIQKIRAALAFWVKEFIGYSLIEFHESLYIEAAIKRLLPNPNVCILGNSHEKRQPILSFLIYTSGNSPSHANYKHRIANDERDEGESKNKASQPLNGRFVAKLLNDLFGVQARGGCACAGPYGHRLLGVDETESLKIRSLIQKGYNGAKPGWTRISFSYYMTKEEFALILTSIEFIAAHGHHFLPLYNYDMLTGDWTFKHRNFKYLLMKNELTLPMSNLLSQNSSVIDQVYNEENDTGKVGKGSKKDSNIRRGAKFLSYLKSAHSIALYLSKNNSPAISSGERKQSLIL